MRIKRKFRTIAATTAIAIATAASLGGSATPASAQPVCSQVTMNYYAGLVLKYAHYAELDHEIAESYLAEWNFEEYFYWSDQEQRDRNLSDYYQDYLTRYVESCVK